MLVIRDSEMNTKAGTGGKLLDEPVPVSDLLPNLCRVHSGQGPRSYGIALPCGYGKARRLPCGKLFLRESKINSYHSVRVFLFSGSRKVKIVCTA